MRKYKPPIKDEDRIITDRSRSVQKTFDRATNLLTYKARSIEELRERLLEKKWTNEEIVEEVIAKLKEYNYLNDQEFASNLAASKLRQKPIGRRRLRETLENKSLEPAVIDAAIEYAYGEQPENELIEKAIEKRLRIRGIPKEYKDRQSFFGYLVRLGFEYDLIKAKLDSLKGQKEDEPDF